MTAPPLPIPDPMTDFFWEAARHGRLMILRCDRCGTYIHLPRPVCRNCRAMELHPAEVSGRGVLYSFTETHKAFHPYFVDRVPYLLGVVELEEQPGLRLLTNLTGVSGDDVRIGMPLQVGFEWLSPELAIPVFSPALSATGTPHSETGR